MDGLNYGDVYSKQQRVSSSFELRSSDDADVSTASAMDLLMQSPNTAHRGTAAYGANRIRSPGNKLSSPSRLATSSADHAMSDSGALNSSMVSTGAAPDSSKQSASSVVLAFRELQARAKQIEYDRIAAQGEVDELRRRLSEAQRHESLHRSKLEVGNTDEVLRIRERNERILLETSDVQRNLTRVTEESQRLHREIATQRARAAALTDEYAKGESQSKALELRIIELRQDIESIDLRCGTMERKLVQSHAAHQRVVESSLSIDELMAKLAKEREASIRAAVRLSALQRYLDIVLQINADLTESMKTREATSNKIFNIVERETRKYMSDRDKSYQSNRSKTTSPGRSLTSIATARAVNETLISARSERIRKGTSMEDRSYQKALEIINGAKIAKQAPSVRRVTAKKKVPKQSNSNSFSSGGGRREMSYTPQRSSESLHRMYVDDNYEASLLKELEQTRSKREENSRDRVYERAMDVLARSEEALVMDDLLAREHRLEGRPPTQRSRREAARNRRQLIDGTEDSLASINSSRSSWLYNPSVLDNLPSKSPERARGAHVSEKSHRRSLSASSGRSQTSEQRRARSRSLSIGDGASAANRSMSYSHEGSPADLVRSAARLAATAVATQAAAVASIDNAEAKRVFLPSSVSPSENKEFNVVASVSKAARSARELNATLASRVKSLDFDGAGPLFSQIEKIDLNDMHEYLNSIKMFHSQPHQGDA